MKKFVNAVFLISGTAIGAGIVALPIAAARVGILVSIIVDVIALCLAYQTSCIVIDLNREFNCGKSIVELSQIFSGRGAKYISLVSFYLLSFALLSVYTAGAAEIVSSSLGLNFKCISLAVCVLGFFLFSLKRSYFEHVNFLIGSLFVVAMLAIFCSMPGMFKGVFREMPVTCDAMALFAFFPIIFTSFGVQNVCGYIYDYLDRDVKKIKLAFLIGISIPAIVYVLWISLTLTAAYQTDANFYKQLLCGQVDAGEFVSFLCNLSETRYINLFFKLFSLLAIITSAIGMGVGMMLALKELLKSDVVVRLTLALVPLLILLCVEDAFMKVLSFGGMIATIFVIFVPVYLQKRACESKKLAWKSVVCLILGVLIVLGDLLNKFF